MERKPATMLSSFSVMEFIRRSWETSVRTIKWVKLRSHAVRLFAMGVFCVYVLHSLSDRGLYIGYSTDLRKRLNQHKQGRSFATKTRGPWKLIYYEAYLEELDAKGRERYLKSGGG